MRRNLSIGLLVLAMAAAACGGGDETPGAGSPTSPGATSPQATPLNDQGTLDATGMSEFSIELDDNYFKPTFIKATPGQTLNIELEGEGASPHTFTISSLNVDHEVPVGGKVEINLSMPASGEDVAFFCRFHVALGMRGAFFFGDSPSADVS